MLVLWAVLLQGWVICILSSMRWLGEGRPGKSLEESSQMECNWRETSRWAFWEWHYLLKGWTVACVRSPVLEHLECSCESMCRSHRLRFHAWMCPQENADCLLPSLGLGFRVPSCKGSACGSISSRLLNRQWVFMLLDCYRHEDEKYVVVAGLLKHTIPCWGYVVQERPHAGRFFSLL